MLSYAIWPNNTSSWLSDFIIWRHVESVLFLVIPNIDIRASATGEISGIFSGQAEQAKNKAQPIKWANKRAQHSRIEREVEIVERRIIKKPSEEISVEYDQRDQVWQIEAKKRVTA